MKILKVILIVVIALAAIVLLTAAFVQKDYAVECNIEIEQPKGEVFDYVKYLENQNNYSVWAQMDPDMDKSYTGTDGAVGFISSWESDNKNVGKGEQEITAIEYGNRIDYELRFMEPFESTDHAFMVTESMNDSTTLVKWGFNGKMNYPMNIMLLFMDMEEMLGDDLNKGLANLKEILE